MRGTRAFGFNREGLTGPGVRGPAAVACTRESGLARVLIRKSPRSGNRSHRGFARRFGRKSGAHGVRPIPLDREHCGALLARRPKRIPPGLAIPTLDRGRCLLVIDPINWPRIEAETGQCFFELAYVAAADSGRHVAMGRCLAAQDEDRTTRD